MDFNLGRTVHHPRTEDFKSPGTVKLAATFQLRGNGISIEKCNIWLVKVKIDLMEIVVKF
jgi:hypothetical protein